MTVYVIIYSSSLGAEVWGLAFQSRENAESKLQELKAKFTNTKFEINSVYISTI